MTLFQETTNPFWLIAFALTLSLVPILVGLSTSYLKVSIVLGMFRSGLGAQQVPGNMVIMCISLVVTMFVMSPVIQESADNLSQGIISFDRVPNASDISALSKALLPWRTFLERHAGKQEIEALKALKLKSKSKEEDLSVGPTNPSVGTDISLLLVSFMLTELKEAFSMGFVLLLPFLVIDLIVSNILVGMGMFMVSPAMITLPLKLMLFIACDGWMLLTKGLVMSYV